MIIKNLGNFYGHFGDSVFFFFFFFTTTIRGGGRGDKKLNKMCDITPLKLTTCTDLE